MSNELDGVLDKLAHDVSVVNTSINRLFAVSIILKRRFRKYRRFLTIINRVLSRGSELQNMDDLGITAAQYVTIKNSSSMEESLREEERQRAGHAERMEVLKVRLRKRVSDTTRVIPLMKPKERPIVEERLEGLKEELAHVERLKPDTLRRSIEEAKRTGRIKAKFTDEEIAEKAGVDIKVVHAFRAEQKWKGQLNKKITQCVRYLKVKIIGTLRDTLKEAEADRERILLAYKDDRAALAEIRDNNEKEVANEIHVLLRSAYDEVGKIFRFARSLIEMAEQDGYDLNGVYGLAKAGVDLIDRTAEYEIKLSEKEAAKERFSDEEKKALRKEVAFHEINQNREKKLGAAVNNFGYLMGHEQKMAEGLAEEMGEARKVNIIRIDLVAAERKLIALGKRVA